MLSMHETSARGEGKIKHLYDARNISVIRRVTKKAFVFLFW